MRAALTVIVILLILGLLAAVGLGLISFFQSQAAERIGNAIAEGIADFCWGAAFGMVFVGCCLGLGFLAQGMGRGLRDGAEPLSSALAMQRVATAIEGAIERGQPVRLPNWNIGSAGALGADRIRPAVSVGQYLEEGESNVGA